MRVSQQKGSFLFEVLLTLSIVSIFLISIIKVLSSHVVAFSTVRHSTEALYLLDAKIHDLKTNPFREKSAEGSFDSPFERFRWSYQRNASAYNDFDEIFVRIFWDEGEVKKSLQRTLILPYDQH